MPQSFFYSFKFRKKYPAVVFRFFRFFYKVMFLHPCFNFRKPKADRMINLVERHIVIQNPTPDSLHRQFEVRRQFLNGQIGFHFRSPKKIHSQPTSRLLYLKYLSPKPCKVVGKSANFRAWQKQGQGKEKLPTVKPEACQGF